MREYDEAIKMLEVAQDHLDNAEPDYIDAAIMELSAAEKRIEAALRLLRREKVNAEG